MANTLTPHETNRNSLARSHRQGSWQPESDGQGKSMRFAEELLKQMPNGYFLEGFVGLWIQRMTVMLLVCHSWDSAGNSKICQL